MNPYEVLGIRPDATEAEIKDAYRKLMLKWHPDKNPSPEAESKSREINRAYDLLTKHRPAIHWIIDGEDIEIRAWQDVEREWQRTVDAIKRAFGIDF